MFYIYSLVQFKGIAAVARKMYNDILRRLRDAVRRKSPKHGEPTFNFSSRQCSSTAVSFVQEILSKKEM
jgi:hypothetical protein